AGNQHVALARGDLANLFPNPAYARASANHDAPQLGNPNAGNLSPRSQWSIIGDLRCNSISILYGIARCHGDVTICIALSDTFVFGSNTLPSSTGAHPFLVTVSWRWDGPLASAPCPGDGCMSE